MFYIDSWIFCCCKKSNSIQVQVFAVVTFRNSIFSEKSIFLVVLGGGGVLLEIVIFICTGLSVKIQTQLLVIAFVSRVTCQMRLYLAVLKCLIHVLLFIFFWGGGGMSFDFFWGVC